LGYQKLIPIIILNLPVLVGSLILFIQGKKENLNLQRFAKILLFAAMAKSIFIMVAFVLCLNLALSFPSDVPSDGSDGEEKRFYETVAIFMGINAAIDIITAYLSLLALRRTNEYMNLISRKAFFEFRNIIDGTAQA